MSGEWPVSASSRPASGNSLIFSQPDSRSRSGLLPAESPWGYSHSIRARRGYMPGLSSCVLGQIMSGVVAAMRRNLLSCTSLARRGLSGLVAAVLLPAGAASAADLAFTDAISAWLDLNHQEFAVLTTALALLGFSVVAAILLMRTRLRAAKSEARLRSDIGELQVQADRFRALLFAEP